MKTDAVLIEIHSKHFRHSLVSFVCSIMLTLFGKNSSMNSWTTHSVLTKKYNDIE